jgi:hypothetical protein
VKSGHVENAMQKLNLHSLLPDHHIGKCRTEALENALAFLNSPHKVSETTDNAK